MVTLQDKVDRIGQLEGVIADNRRRMASLRASIESSTKMLAEMQERTISFAAELRATEKALAEELLSRGSE